jgi:triosephosphate isomerase (TIM)
VRRLAVVANWKMNCTRVQANELVTNILHGSEQLTAVADYVICPPAVYLDQVSKQLQGTKFKLGAQNVAFQAQGALTGEIAPFMLREFGCEYVIIGHSERRSLLAEPSDWLVKKINMALENGLTPIFCIGESREQYEAGKSANTLVNQLNDVLSDLGVAVFAKVILAYEPVWAIGTGLTATPEHAQRMHEVLRGVIAEQDPAIAQGLRILYGGSVTSANAHDLFMQPDVDGGLIGGASLKAQEFVDICKIVQEISV